MSSGEEQSDLSDFAEVSVDPNGVTVNGFNSFKMLSNDSSRLDTISENCPSSAFMISPDKEVDAELIFRNMVQMYQQQLKHIDTLDWEENRKLQEKVKVLEDFVDQLLEQNEVLISTAVELEREAKKRVYQMEGRLKKSARSTKEVVLCLHEYEQHMQDLVMTKAQLEAELEDLKRQSSTAKVENSFLRDQNANLRHDLHALLHVVQQARTTGNWEMDWVTFCELSPEQVFGPIGTFSRIHSGESLSQAVSVHTADDILHRGYCSSDRGSCGASHYSSFSNLHDADQALLSRKYDPDSLSRLQVENQHLQKLREQSQLELLDKDKIIANLESQITCLNQEMALQQLERDRQLLMCRTHSLEMSAKPVHRHNSNGAQSLHCLCHHVSCSNCEMLQPLEEKCINYAERTLDNLNVRSSLQLLSSADKKPVFINSNAIANSSSEQSSFCGDLNDQQHISSLFDSAHVQTDERAVISVGVQVEIKNNSISLQTEEPKKLVEDLMANSSDDAHRKIMENMKDLLTRAEDTAASKEMLVSQLQTHLQTSVREVELKDKALENAESKLNFTRKECVALKEKISELESKIGELNEELHRESSIQKNLNENVHAREERIQELKLLEETLQDQKRRLLTQVDEQGEEILAYKAELEIVKGQMKNSLAEAELQKLTIQNLQEALIASKTMFESRRQPANAQHTSFQNNVARRAVSQSSILDI